MYKPLILLIVTTILYSCNLFAGEVITSFNDESVPVLNEEIRKINTNLYSKVAYVDRGTATGYDKHTADFTTDGDWHDLDLSAIVPAGAKAINIHLGVRDDAVESLLRFRKNGDTGLYNISSVFTYVSDKWSSIEFIIACDDNRTIEYAATDTTWTEIALTVKGWFIKGD